MAKKKGLTVSIYKVEIATWKVLAIFILGAAVGEIMPEPTDWINFLAEQNGWNVDPVVEIFNWYFLSAIFYFIVLAFIIMAWHYKIGSPVVVVYALIIMLGVGAILSMRIIFSNTEDVPATIFITISIIGVTLIGILYLAGYRVRIKNRSRKGRRR
jgi:hypothetical protein